MVILACCEKTCELLCAQDNIKVIVLCVVVALCGAFGGFVGGIYRWKCGISPKPSCKAEFCCFALCGLVSAFAIMLVCKWMGLVFDNPSSLSKGMYVIGISVVAGFFAMRILPHLGSVIEDRLSQLSQKVDETRQQVAENGARIQDDEDYHRLLGRAEMALSTNEPTDRREAIKCIEEDLDRFAHRRTINIYYGRLLRREGEYSKAIMALNRFIKTLKAKRAGNLHRNDRSALGAAYFNIACYYGLLLSRGGKTSDDDILEKLKSALREAINSDSIYARLWQDDEDLKPIADKYHDLV